MASTYLSRSNGTPTSQQIFTFSAWVKRSKLNPSGNNMQLFSQYNDTSNRMDFRFQTGDTIDFYHTSSLGRITTNRLFRDTSAWYHIVLRVDTTQATSSDRYRLYINGVQETSFSTATYPSQNANLGTNFSTFSIGDDSYGSSDFDGCMTHIHYTDGQSYDATAFGQTDANGVWTIKTSPSVTYGTNGFFILKDGNSVTDQSGNGNNFTVAGGTLTQTEDNPSNIFATLNPLFPTTGTSAYSNGNLTVECTGSAGSSTSSLGVSSGKWYMEVKQKVANEPLGNGESGICVVGDPTGSLGNVSGTAFSYGIRNYQGIKFENASETTSWHGNWTAGDIISIALDMDNNRVYFAKNGQYADGSGNWNQSFTGSPAYLSLSTAKTNYFLAMSQLHGSATETYEANFGNGYFGTTAVSSAGTNASGNGIFEYDVPTGYTALSTKGLNL